MEPKFYKDYRLGGFPEERMAGRPFLPFREYVEWLAEFLHQADMEVDERQRPLFDQIAGFDSKMAVRCIGIDAGLHDNLAYDRPFYNFPEGFDIKKDMEEAKTWVPEVFPYEDLPEEQKEEQSLEEFIIEDYEWNLLLKDERKQFELYWPGFRKSVDMLPPFARQDEDILSGEGEPPDAGWRVLLSAIIKTVEGREDRVRALISFFIGYVEYLNK